MKIDLKDVTFCIPVRRDSMDREQNIDLIVKYLKKYFDCTIFVGEESDSNYFSQMEPPLADGLVDKIFWYESKENYFHRTKVLNNLAREATTKFIVNYDCDVLFPVKSYVDAVEKMRSGESDFVYPYLGKFLEVSRWNFSEILKTLSLNCVDINKCTVNHPNSVGGAIFENREKFIESGMENENFISYGYEDNERIYRWLRLGYKVGRVGSELFHMEHFRGDNSGPSNPFFNTNSMEYFKINNMTASDLIGYIKTWKWLGN